MQGRETKGKSQIWEKDGGQAQADSNFDSLSPADISNIPTGRTGTLSDGRNINVQTDSSDGRSTVEIQNTNGTRIKIRYNN